MIGFHRTQTIAIKQFKKVNRSQIKPISPVMFLKGPALVHFSSCYISTISTHVQVNLGLTFLLMTLRSSRSLYAAKNVKAPEASNIQLQMLYVWLTADKLKLNTNKSNFILFHPYQLACQSKICMFDNEQNKYVDLESKVSIKYLGVLMDKNLTRSHHIDAIATNLS